MPLPRRVQDLPAAPQLPAGIKILVVPNDGSAAGLMSAGALGVGAAAPATPGIVGTTGSALTTFLLSTGLTIVGGNTLTLAAGWSNLPTEAQAMPVAVPFAGKPSAFTAGPPATGRVCVGINESLTLPANLVGTVMKFITLPASTATFAISTMHGTTITALGNITYSTGGAVTLPSCSAVNLVSGDMLIVDPPASQDANLADGCLTFMLQKV